MGAGVEQFIGIDARRRRACDVADIVGAGALGGEAEIGEPFEQRGCVLRRDLAHLQIGAGGDVGIGAAQRLGEIGDARELPGLQNAVGDAQAAHIAVLRRGHVEQTVIAPAEIVFRLGVDAGIGLILEAGIGIEGMLGCLPLLLIDELAAGRDGFRLRFQMLPVRAGGRRAAAGRAAKRSQPARRAGRLHAAHEAFEIALLVGCEIVAHGFNR